MNFNSSALTKQQTKIAIAWVALSVFALQAPGKSSAGLREELLNVEAQISKGVYILSKKDVLDKEYKDSLRSLEKMGIYIPDSSDRYAWAYEYISHCSKQAGVMIDGIQEELPTAASKADNVPLPYEMKITLMCGYNELVCFLWHLETGNPLILVKEFTINHLPDDPDQQRVRIVIQWPPAFKINMAGM